MSSRPACVTIPKAGSYWSLSSAFWEATMRRLAEREDDLVARKRPLREVGKLLELVSG
jgi:hypothetical protein